MLDALLHNQAHMQLAFVACLVLALITIPLRDIITVGFFDISDFWVSLMIAFFIGFMINEYEQVSLLFFGLITASSITAIVLLNIFVIIPFKSRAENSSATSIYQLEGKEATVSVPIPANGMGEVLVYTGFAKVNRMARIYDNTDGITHIPTNQNVLIMDIKDSIVYVLPYTNAIQATHPQQPTWNTQHKK